MNATLFEKIVKTRKDRSCFMCLRVFSKGTMMRFWKGVYEGQINSTYNCKTCSKIMDLIREESYPEGYVSEWLNKDQTPEELLIQIQNQETK